MKIGNSISRLAIAAALTIPVFGGGSSQSTPTAASNPNLERDVRRAINKLAYYDVFDDLGFQVSPQGVVTLVGEVTNYPVHNSALSAVKSIQGVTGVEDQIEVLPLSRFDDDLRIRAYNAIFGFPALSRYALNSRPSIHIIVKDGNIALEGVVNKEFDRQLAETRLRSLPFAFKITNNLRLDP